MAAHIAGIDNSVADSLSRDFNTSVVWSLDDKMLKLMCTILGRPSIDLFASRLSHKVRRLRCRGIQPDPVSFAAYNAFSIDWEGIHRNMDTHFRLLNWLDVFQLWKLEWLEHTAASILPVCHYLAYWPSQPWFPHLSSLLIAQPVFLPSSLSLLRCPIRQMPHPSVTSTTTSCMSLSNSPPQHCRLKPSPLSAKVGKPPPRRTTH